jgi:hypothetical protein
VGQVHAPSDQEGILMHQLPRPLLADFLAAPQAEVAAVAPATVIYTPGGTRRAAVLAGIDLRSEEYPAWTLRQMWGAVAVMARAGVRNLAVNVSWPGQFAETTPHYRERLFSWIADGLGGALAREQYERLALAPRLLHADDEALAPLRGCLDGVQAHGEGMRVWWYVCPDHNLPWRALARACATGAASQTEIIRAICGEDVPPAELLVSFSKPLLSHGIMPLYLIETTSAYWTQTPGFSLDERAFRRIVYDHHYLRSTWSADKTSRYTQLGQLAGQSLQHIVGLGRRVGPFWIADEDFEGDGSAD